MLSNSQNIRRIVVYNLKIYNVIIIIFSTGLSSGDFGGNGKRVMLSGTGSFFETCHPA